tara:strand:+ start:594 stop:1469 length:876 start_codon:yes stop_codon:yes gene_type:complete
MKILKYIFEAIFFYILFFIIKILGIKLGRKICSFLFLKFGIFFRSKNIINENISNVFKNISKEDANIIINSMWENYGYILAEYMYLDKFRLNKFSNLHIQIKGKEILDNVLKSKKPSIFISGHFGNFELMAMELEKYGINLAAIYRPLNNIFLNPFMIYLRKKYICKNQIAKGVSGTRKVIEYIKKNYSVALMVDQRLGESERFPFFNKTAHTTTLPAQLALKFECNIIPIYFERKDISSFEMEVLKPIEFHKTNDLDKDKKNITIKINKEIEKMVIKNPKQWIWTHGRWK